MDEDGMITDPAAVALIDKMAGLYRRNKVLLDSWEGFMGKEFVDNLLELKETRAGLGTIVGDQRAFETSRDLYWDLFKPGF
jgi:hypothetical protein